MQCVLYLVRAVNPAGLRIKCGRGMNGQMDTSRYLLTVVIRPPHRMLFVVMATVAAHLSSASEMYGTDRKSVV